jgi:hypothetical protein
LNIQAKANAFGTKGCVILGLGCLGGLIAFVLAGTIWNAAVLPKLDRLVSRDLSVLHIGDSCDAVRTELREIGATVVQSAHIGCLGSYIYERVPTIPFASVAQIELQFGRKVPFGTLTGVLVHRYGDGI